MPTVFSIDGFRFIILPKPEIHSGGRAEHCPPHVVVQKGGEVVEVWLAYKQEILQVKRMAGAKKQTVRHILKLVKANNQFLVEAWENLNGEC